MKIFSFVVFFLHHKFRRLAGMSQKLGALERGFCEENGIDPEKVLRSHFFELFGQFDRMPLATQIDAMVIPKKKRFGNALLQLADAYNIAKQLGVPKIYHRGYSFLNDDAQVGDIRFLKGVPSKNEKYLIGDFYENKSLLGLCHDKLDRWEVVHALSDHVRLNLKRLAEDETRNVLYIHLRSGDIFKKHPPHRDYGQPPFAFYTKIIRSREWQKVVMVFEDKYNPVINALLEFLAQQKIRCETYSGDVHQDIEILLRAKHLVIARGTFIYPVLSLSQNVKEVFYFEIDEHSPWGLENSHITFKKCIDTAGQYRNSILTAWENDACQNELMLSYSEDNIQIGMGYFCKS